ncbi:hypothetical protein QZH41_007192 [Actinostola sp. cb2023]|nr:hypothetical protein QZH41_007192 [Actinostola sp. cb2023]
MSDIGCSEHSIAERDENNNNNNNNNYHKNPSKLNKAKSSLRHLRSPMLDIMSDTEVYSQRNYESDVQTDGERNASDTEFYKCKKARERRNLYLDSPMPVLMQKDKEKLKKSSNASNKDEEEKTEDNSSGEMTSGDEEDDEEEEEDGDSDGDGEGDDSEVKENDDSSSDEKDIESESEGKIAEELAELSTEIEIKEKLVEELEISQERMHSMKTQYEEKLLLLTHKIKDTEEERDHVLKNIKEHDTGAAKQVKQLKDEYEKKLGNLKTELKKLQVAKKNHAQLVRDKTRNEQQLRIYTNELNDMKKVKARLMKQMKDEIAKNKHQEMARNKEITQLKKVSRMREIAIKNLESEKRQKEIILKRKQDEVKALRRQQKPVSGPLGARKNQVTSSQTVNGIEPLDEMEPSSAAPSGYGTYGYKGSSVYNKPYGGPPRMGLAGREKRKRVTIEQSVKIAKKKWDNIERKVSTSYYCLC